MSGAFGLELSLYDREPVRMETPPQPLVSSVKSLCGIFLVKEKVTKWMLAFFLPGWTLWSVYLLRVSHPVPSKAQDDFGICLVPTCVGHCR